MAANGGGYTAGGTCGSNGSGAGGRVAIVYGGAAPAFALQAYPGKGGEPGGAGTIVLRSTDPGGATALVVDANGYAAASTPQLVGSAVFDTVAVTRGGVYTLSSGQTLEVTVGEAVAGGIALGATNGTPRARLEVPAGATLTLPAGSAWVQRNLDVSLYGELAGPSSVTFAAGTLRASGATAWPAGLTELAIGSDGVLSQSGTAAITLPSLVVQSLGSVTHEANVASADGTPQHQVNVAATTIDVRSGGSVTANGRGYPGNTGRTGTTLASYQGGSHGGVGGHVTNVGYAYDDVTAPTRMGGGGAIYNSSAGPGGGVIRLVASGTLTIDGAVSANGLAGSSQYAGMGAGGAVQLDAGALAGAGTVSANGAGWASGWAGGGGGGRVAVAYSGAAPALVTTAGKLSAAGGASSNSGGAGTIWVLERGTGATSLTLDNGNAQVGTGGLWTTLADAVTTPRTVVVRSGAALLVASGQELAIAPGGSLSGNGATNPRSLVQVASGGTLTAPAAAFSVTGVDVMLLGTLSGATDLSLQSARFTLGASRVLSPALASIDVGASGELVQGGAAPLPLTSLTVRANGKVTHLPNAASADGAPQNQVNVEATTITIQANGSVTADGLGFPSNTGPTGTSLVSYQGGSHGGLGGHITAIGYAYDDVTSPSRMGGAGAVYSTTPGGAGGGVIRLVATGTLTIDGAVTADGLACTSQYGGMGAGGAVSLDAGALAGTGTVRANGAGYANGHGGGGGGGRVAIAYSGAAPALLTTSGKVAARGGQTTNSGAAGTAWLVERGSGAATLVVDNEDIQAGTGGAWTTLSATATTAKTVVVRRRAALYVAPGQTLAIAAGGSLSGSGAANPRSLVQVASGGTLTAPSAAFSVSGVDVTLLGTLSGVTDLAIDTARFTLGATRVLSPAVATIDVGASGELAQGGTAALPLTSLTVRANGRVTHLANAASADGAPQNQVNIDAGTIDIQALGVVTATGLGFPSNTAPSGTTLTSYQGGSHGGLGGHVTTLGATYDDVAAPSLMGGAGVVYSTSPGGAGGGVIRLRATGTLTVNGTVSADGTQGSNQYAGRGAGGAVQLDAGALAGAGLVTANGGDYTSQHGGGGGGGRVAIAYTGAAPALLTTAGKVAARGGISTHSGAAGTLWFLERGSGDATLIVDNDDTVCGTGGLWTTLSASATTARTVIVRDRGALWVGAGQELAIAPGGALSGGGGGSPRAVVQVASGGTLTAPAAAFPVSGVDVTLLGTLSGATDLAIDHGRFYLGATRVLSPAIATIDVGVSGVLTQAGTAVLPLTTLTVRAGGKVDHDANVASADGSPQNQVNIVATTIDVQSGGVVTATGLGFPANTGRAGTTMEYYLGGSHGGLGGVATNLAYTYDAVQAPALMGGGGSNYFTSPGGAGGGVIRLVATGTLTVSGTIAADGVVGTNQYAGRGAGGAVQLDAGALAGAGLVTTNGGDAGTQFGGGGGGGRVAIAYTGAAPALLTTAGKLASRGGTSSTYPGAAGTVWTLERGSGAATLLVDNDDATKTDATLWTTLSDSVTSVQRLVVRDRGALVVRSGQTLALVGAGPLTGSGATGPRALVRVDPGGALVLPEVTSLDGLDVDVHGVVSQVSALTVANATYLHAPTSPITFASVTANAGGVFELGGTSTVPIGTLTVRSGGVVTHTAGVAADGTTATHRVDIAANAITVESGGAISVTGKGHPENAGVGAGAPGWSAGGGAHAGTGGQSSGGYAGGATTYGSASAPVAWGSGGGHDSDSATYRGGAGGGAIKLSVCGTLQVDGQIVASGQNGTAQQAGGGAGGSIWILAGQLAGSGAGSIRANGGAGGSASGSGGGGGGGGRVAVRAKTSTFDL
ncbi:MAG: hypothetical protein KC635_21510, partial [Myxococcales bacterium]|nr:hypothetical protein [Myxococcales bacterium]